MDARIELLARDFDGGGRLLLDCEAGTAEAFRFASGVAALRMTTEAGEIVSLPFQGQQIWSARML